MKVLAVLLLCAFVAVQGRSAGGKSSKSLAELGEIPSLLHLRVARSTSGYLDSGAGSLIGDRWVLTAAETVKDARFIWIRYGVVNVVNPELVTEASIVINSPDGKLALININRNVESTENISPVSKVGGEVPESAVFYGFGENEEGDAGEVLKSFGVSLEEKKDGAIIASSDEGKASKHDLGAPLMIDNVQVGVLVKEGSDDNAGEFVSVADYLEWIESETGLDLGSSQPEDSVRVQFVN